MRSTLSIVLVGLASVVGCATAAEPDSYLGPPGGSGNPDNGTITEPPGNDAGTKPGSGSPPPGKSDGGTQGPGPDAGSQTGTPPSGGLAPDVTVNEVAIYQAVKIDVVANGTKVAKYNASIVAGRDALVRVFVAPGAGFSSRPLTAELTLVNGSDKKVLTAQLTPSGSSSDSSLSSTFNFDVPGASLTDQTQFAVAVRDPATSPSANASGPAQYPADGTPVSLGVHSTGAQLKVVVVPIQYGADGSNRTPDTSSTQLNAYQQMMYALYPAAKVDVTVRAPYPYGSNISANGNGWSQVLQAIQNLREQDGVGSDVYYYGAFEPADSFDAFCGGGCVTGLSSLSSDPSDSFVRASVGIGYAGRESSITMAHELGHAHGRQHSPCGGAADPDPSYPYDQAGIGVWGYDLTTKQLISTSQGKDIMGYCSPEWISDYTYEALVQRMQYVNNASMVVGQFVKPMPYRFVDLANDGTLSWGNPVTLRSKPGGDTRTVTWYGANGAVLATGTAHVYAYDHLKGGYALVPEAPAGAKRAAIAGLGSANVTR